jgi:hypothetical protein
MKPKSKRKFPDYGLDPQELSLFRRLDTPAKVQDYLDGLPVNFDGDDDTCSSPRVALRRGTVHCIEAAMLAAAVLAFHGQRAWLLDLKANDRDYDHVMCLFRKGGRWGAISKTRYLALRYREPVYRTVRELAMSCFHEYINADGEKTLRSFSAPWSMSKFGQAWVTSPDDLWEVANGLDKSRHFDVLPKGYRPRPASPFEAWASEITEWIDAPGGPRKRPLK